MNTYKRSQELARIADTILREMGLDAVTEYDLLRPAVLELRARTGCQYTSARAVIARHIRKHRGLIVGDYHVTSVSKLPFAKDHGQDIPLVLVAEQP